MLTLDMVMTNRNHVLHSHTHGHREGERLVIELGRALRKGEYKCKVFYMRLADCSAPEFERLQPVCEYILCSGADVGSTKRAIISQLASMDPKYNAAYEVFRLRRKSYRSPLDVHTDEQKFGEDIRLAEKMEVHFVCVVLGYLRLSNFGRCSSSCKSAMSLRNRVPIWTTRSYFCVAGILPRIRCHRCRRSPLSMNVSAP